MSRVRRQQRDEMNETALKMASARFIPGPAAATKAESSFGLRSARKFTGTGLAYPNRNGECVIINSAGRRIVPNGSMCFSGLLTRP